MSTLTSTSESSPVKVMRVFANFRHGMPATGTVFVGAERHRVRLFRTAGGLMAQCACSHGCPAGADAIRAFKSMVDAWERVLRTPAGADMVAIIASDAREEASQPAIRARPYDGLARSTCEADLQLLPIPPWAYDEHGLRRPLVDAQLAADVWHEVSRTLDRLLAEGSEAPATLSPSNVLRYYRASWEPDLGLSQTAYEVDLPFQLGGPDDEPDNAA